MPVSSHIQVLTGTDRYTYDAGMSLCPYCATFTPPRPCAVPRCGGLVCTQCSQCNRQEHFHPRPGRSGRRSSRTARAITALMVVAAAGITAAACAAAPPAAHARTRRSASMPLSTLAVCRRLRADMVANGGTPDRPALAYLAGHAASPEVASLAWQASRDVGSTRLLFSPSLALLTHQCGKDGVQLP